MIWRYNVRKAGVGYYITSEAMLMSGETSGNWAHELREDRFWGEASYFAGRAKEGTQFVTLASDTGYTAFSRLPQQAYKHIKPGDRERVERGQTVSIYACIY